MSENNELLLTLKDLLGPQTDQEEVLHSLPQEGMDFGAGDFIAQFTISIMYRFFTQKDYGHIADVTPPAFRVEKGDWYIHYHHDYNEALDAYTVIEPEALNDRGGHKTPNTVLTFYAPTSTVLNTPDSAKFQEGFGQQLTMDVPVVSLRSGGKYKQSNRHAYHFLALPGLINAFARITGKDTTFDIDELVQPGAEVLFTPEWFDLSFGSVNGDYHGTVYAMKRAKLWADLGESDFTTCAVIGSKTAKGKPDSHATTSEDLSNLLRIVQGEPRVFWARVTNIPDPCLDNMKDGKRYNIPVMTEVFASEAHAAQVAAAEMAERGVEVDDAPPLPENWNVGDPKSARAQWVKALKEFAGPPSKIQEVLYANPGEVALWRAYVEEKGL